jgi:putative intracellular protease/amidase
VTSSGGLKVTPNMAVADIDVSSVDALVVNGGTAWSQPDAPDIGAVLIAARDAGKTVAGICDATLAMAKAGVLDAVPHTSNSADNLPRTGYNGAAHYQDQPAAVVAGRIVTAPGTAPVSFMAGVLETLGLRDANLDYYVGMHGAEHGTR